jgi:hypothetical protein
MKRDAERRRPISRHKFFDSPLLFTALCSSARYMATLTDFRYDAGYAAAYQPYRPTCKLL